MKYKRFSKALTLLLALVTLVSTLAISASAATLGDSNCVYFRQDNSNKDLFPDLLSGDLFLGLEDLGEFHVEGMSM